MKKILLIIIGLFASTQNIQEEKLILVKENLQENIEYTPKSSDVYKLADSTFVQYFYLEKPDSTKVLLYEIKY